MLALLYGNSKEEAGMISIRNVTRRFDNNVVLENLSEQFIQGEISTIIAPNGTGKTVLLSLIAGFITPSSGQIVFSDGYTHSDIALLLPGEKNLYMKNTVEENVLYFGSLMGLNRKKVLQSICKYKKMFPIYDQIRHKTAETLSYGQKRMASLFSAIVSETRCIIIDEASEGLDLENVNCLIDMLQNVKKDRLIILSTHDYSFAAKVSDRFLFLKNGEIVHRATDVSYEELLSIYKSIFENGDK